MGKAHDFTFAKKKLPQSLDLSIKGKKKNAGKNKRTGLAVQGKGGAGQS